MALSKTFQKFIAAYAKDEVDDRHLRVMLGDPDGMLRLAKELRGDQIALLPPDKDEVGNPITISEMVIWNGRVVYSLNKKSGSALAVGSTDPIWLDATSITHITTLRKLGWEQNDMIVVLYNAIESLEGGYSPITDSRAIFIKCGEEEEFVMPEKVCLLQKEGQRNLIYAKRNAMGRTSLYSSLNPGERFYAKCDHLVDYWVYEGCLWFVEREGMSHLILRIIAPDYQLVKRLEVDSWHYIRPTKHSDYIYWPVKPDKHQPFQVDIFVRGDNEPRVTTENIDLCTKIYFDQDGKELWLRRLDPGGPWMLIHGLDGSYASHEGVLLRQPNLYNHKLLWAMNDIERGVQCVVYDNDRVGEHSAVDHTQLQVHRDRVVYPATTGSGNKWAVFCEGQPIDKPCDKVIEIDVSGPKIVTYTTKGRKVFRRELDV